MAMQRARFARANHFLVPDTSAERDRLRRTRLGRYAQGLGDVFGRFSREGMAFVTLMMASSLFAFDVKRTQIWVPWGALSGLLAASWLMSFFYGMRGVTGRVLLPRRIPVATPVLLTVELENATPRDRFSLRIRGPFLPWDGEWIRRGSGLPKLAANGRGRFELEASFAHRGEHHLDPFRVRALVPLGLAQGAPVVTEAPRFLVVPRIAVVGRLELLKTRRQHSGGVPRASHTADSRELSGVRPYRPGDPVRDLHVRTWARTGIPFVREYQEEFFTHVAVVVDGAALAEVARSSNEAKTRARSRSRRRRSVRKRLAEVDDLPLEAVLSLAAGVIAKILIGEAIVDLYVLGGDATAGANPIALGRGRGLLEVALDRLATASRDVELDVDAAAAPLLANKDRLSSVVVLLSGWDDRRAAFVKRLESEGMSPLTLEVTSVTAPPAGANPAEGGEGSGAHRKIVAQHVLDGTPIDV